MRKAQKPKQCPIIGVGASAGGLKAFKSFVGAIPKNSGLAYVLVQHLDPRHTSSLPEILQKGAKIPVLEIVDGARPLPDHIYVIPSSKGLRLKNGTFYLPERPTSGPNYLIDVFFESLAESNIPFCVGVVLSGAGSDGSEGLKRIKDAGGFGIAQDPASAEYGALPQNAIDSGSIDRILPPDRIPAQLLKILSDIKSGKARNGEAHAKGKMTFTGKDEKKIGEVLLLLQRRHGVDFAHYKQSTVQRRIAKRIAVVKTKSVSGYHDLLKKDRSELDALFQDMLISVTHFFRDTSVFGTLTDSVFPEMLSKKSGNEPLRVWIAGCSTGQEAYSVAMCLHEFLEHSPKSLSWGRGNIQIFASDLSESAIAKARTGSYGEADIAHLSKRQLEKYFDKESGVYRVKKIIRDMCVYAQHNFLKDPPFGNMDLISCRNVLIYMENSLQQKALTTFHYALREEGFLLLGQSESDSPASQLFSDFDKHSKIYTRKRGSGNLSGHSDLDRTVAEKRKEAGDMQNGQKDFLNIAEALLLSDFTPAGVIVNSDMEVVHIHGTIAPYLEPPPGKPTFQLMKMAKKGLAFEMRNAIMAARSGNSTAAKEKITVEHGGKRTLVSIRAIPLKDSLEPHYLVLFTQHETPSGSRKKYGKTPSRTEGGTDGIQIKKLEDQLLQTREDMRSVLEDMETANEELQSANEELHISNEELKSLNEELETAKEELQSSNEELVIVNQELEAKQGELNSALNYTEAVLDTLREPFLVLDKNLKVQEANKAFLKKFRIREQDIMGKSLFMVQGAEWDRDELAKLLENLLPQHQQLLNYEMTVNFPDQGQQRLLLNAREIVDETTSEKLILFAMEDITERKTKENKLSDYREELEIAVKKRTEELVISNAKLKKRNGELEKAHERLDQFAHAATHDLQEPLRKILTFSDRMRESDKFRLPEKATGYLNKIESSSQRMSELIRSLLNYSRIMNHQDLWVETDLNQTVKEVLTDFELIIEEKNAKIQVKKLPRLEAMPMQMTQLFHNLIGNALKFTVDGTAPVVTLSAREMTAKQVRDNPTLVPDMGYYEIVVRDNGIGFNEDFRERIFEVFGRLNSKDKFEGTGIGLALVKKIVENHNGTITARSRHGGGAAFHLILPQRQLEK